MTKKAEAAINWSAKEYIPRDKNTSWYVWLVLIALVLVGLSVWLQWWTFTVVVVLGTMALVVGYTNRAPRELHYSLNNQGIVEGNKLYNYEDFRAFGVLKTDENFSIMLTPRKRFLPRVEIFFPQEQGEAIVDALGARLPMEEVKLDFLDKIVKFLKI